MTEITEATPKDIPVIRELSHKIWPDAFENILTPGQMDYMLGWMYNPESLKRQMDNGHQFLLLKEDEKYCGYCAYEHKKELTKLHKIYLLRKKWGCGMGSTLLQEVMARAKNAGSSALQLNVNRHNRAVDFYKKLGFKIIRQEDNDIGHEYFMNDYVMELQI